MRSRYLRPWAWLSGWTFFLFNIYCTYFVSQLSRTKAAYSQREIGTSSKTENFVNRLGKGEAYNNLAAAKHSPKDCITAPYYLKCNRETAEELGDRWGEGTVSGREVGLVLKVLGDDMSKEGTAYGNLGNDYYCLGYFKRAKDCFERRQDQIKKWCVAIFAIPIVVLCFILFWSIIFSTLQFDLRFHFSFILTIFLSFFITRIFKQIYSAGLKKAADKISRYFWLGKGRQRKRDPYKCLN